MSLPNLLAKTQRLDRCIARIREEYTGHEAALESDYRLQDSVILNLQRACEQTIDIAQILVKHAGLPRPATNGELFDELAGAGIIEPRVGKRLRGLVGFRNVAVHEYQKLDLAIVRTIIAGELDGLLRFAGTAVAYLEEGRGGGA